MKIENGKYVLEVITCPYCKEGKMDQGITCPNWNKTVNRFPGRVCPSCGSKNKHDHKLIGTRIVDCYFCNGTGRYQERITDFHSIGVVKPITTIMRWGGEFNTNFGVIHSITTLIDYGEMYKRSDDEALAFVNKYEATTQICNLCSSTMIVEPLILVISANGWTLIRKGLLK